ncbi:hypothetical protein C8J57DRAFT_1556966 [Mycena rebaudengoi]|nr:hypothetical protein C8J57DRAFT_1556966 [Mycena rebaudengoi]
MPWPDPAYAVLPTSANGLNGHGPPHNNAKHSWAVWSAPPTRVRRLLLLGAVLALSSTALIYYSVRGGGREWWADGGRGGYENLNAGAEYNDEYEYVSAQTPGENASPFFRDPHPALHAQRFLKQAQKEIRARRDLDTCGGKLGERMVESVVLIIIAPHTNIVSRQRLPRLRPKRLHPPVPHPNNLLPRRRRPHFNSERTVDAQNTWWPYPRAPCISHNIVHPPAWGDAGAFAGNCERTELGARLATAMGREKWVGMGFEETEGELFFFFFLFLGCVRPSLPIVVIPRCSSAFPLPPFPALTIPCPALSISAPDGAHGQDPRFFVRRLHGGRRADSACCASGPPMPLAVAASVRGEAGSGGSGGTDCGATCPADKQVVHLVLFVPRQDKWNPLDRVGAFPARTAAEGFPEGPALLGFLVFFFCRCRVMVLCYPDIAALSEPGSERASCRLAQRVIVSGYAIRASSIARRLLFCAYGGRWLDAIGRRNNVLAWLQWFTQRASHSAAGGRAAAPYDVIVVSS